MAEDFLAAWNSQLVDRVVSCYTPDVIYRDPNTRGHINGSKDLSRYLAKLFSNWKMTWATREVFPFGETDGAAFLWKATFRKPGGDKIVEADGMDLVVVKNNLIARNEVYFDRAALMPLMGA